MPHSVHPYSQQNSPQEEDVSQRYWNVNIPCHEWTAECPAFLIGSSEKDQHILATSDVDYVYQTWNEVKEVTSKSISTFPSNASNAYQLLKCSRRRDARFRMAVVLTSLVGTNRLDLFRRLPSDLRQYRKYIFDLKRSHGSVLAFVQHERLRWEDVTPSGDPPFMNPLDYRILYNDWPYGVEADSTHLVVWTKFPLEEDPETGDLASRAREEVQAFVVRTFCGEKGVSLEQVQSFKNWKSLKSVHALGEMTNLVQRRRY